MEIKCPHCNYQKNVDDEKVPDHETFATCPTCHGRFKFKKDIQPQEIKNNELNFTWKTEPPKTPFYKKRVNILLILLTLLIVSYPGLSKFAETISYKYQFQNYIKGQNATDRANSPGWSYDLRSFSSTSSQQELEAMFKKDGFHVRSFQGHGITPNDKTMCWMNVKDFWNIPATTVCLFFGENGKLNSIRFALPPEHYSDFTQYLSSVGQKLTSNIGKDGLGGKPMEGWIFETGIILTSSSPDVHGDVIAFWMTKETLTSKTTSEHNSSPVKFIFRGFNKSDAKVLSSEIEKHWGKSE